PGPAPHLTPRPSGPRPPRAVLVRSFSLSAAGSAGLLRQAAGATIFTRPRRIAFGPGIADHRSHPGTSREAPAMALLRLRLTLRRAMLVIAAISALLALVHWVRKNVPTSYEEMVTRGGSAEYREYYADGTVRERDRMSGRWVRRPKTPSELRIDR